MELNFRSPYVICIITCLFFICCAQDNSQSVSKSTEQNAGGKKKVDEKSKKFDEEIIIIRAEALEKELFRRTQFKTNNRKLFPECYFDVFMGGFGGGNRQGNLIGQSFSFKDRISILCNEYEKINSDNSNIEKIDNIRNSETMIAITKLLNGFEKSGMNIKKLDEASFKHEEAAALIFYIQDQIQTDELTESKLILLKNVFNKAKEFRRDAVISGLNTEFIKPWEQESLNNCILFTESQLKSLIK